MQVLYNNFISSITGGKKKKKPLHWRALVAGAVKAVSALSAVLAGTSDNGQCHTQLCHPPTWPDKEVCA